MNSAEFISWRNDPVTKEILAELQSLKDDIMEDMFTDGLLSNPDGLLLLNRYKGQVDFIDYILNKRVEDEDVEDSQGPRP